MKRMALPAGRLRPSLGGAPQTVESTVTSLGSSHTGGLPLAARLKAKTSRVRGVSQSAATPLAIHAGGVPPVAELSPVVDWTFR